MKWSGEHDVMLGREIMLFELFKYTVRQGAVKGANS